MVASYSFAGPRRGSDDPENVEIYDVNSQDDCPVGYCRREDGEPHIIVIWSGNEYSEKGTWFSVGEDSLIDLEKAR